MAIIDSDKVWRSYGKKDPYFGVLTHDKFRDANMTNQNREEFFETGMRFVKRVFKELHRHFDPDFLPENVLDFGCGTGRLSIGFAPSAHRVVGIDISEDMLSEARRNAQALGHGHLEFFMSDDRLSAVENEQFDLVNCYIVLQHIRSERGLIILQKLLERIKPGGYGVIQLNYTCQKGRLGHFVDYFRYRIPMVHGILNLMQKRPYSDPLMQMNEYDLNKTMYLLQKSGIREMFVENEVHGNCWGVTFFLKKPLSSE